jgi:hypothetical protein
MTCSNITLAFQAFNYWARSKDFFRKQLVLKPSLMPLFGAAQFQVGKYERQFIYE